MCIRDSVDTVTNIRCIVLMTILPNELPFSSSQNQFLVVLPIVIYTLTQTVYNYMSSIRKGIFCKSENCSNYDKNECVSKSITN